MKLKKGRILELGISDIAFGGRGLVRVEGLVVFVDGAVPGDRVMARVVRRKKQYAEARVLELLEPSPDRRSAPCRYSGYCGGCRWQHLNYAKQLEYKQRHVVEALEHIGGLRGAPVHAVVPAPQEYGYRNKMEFTCSDRRWLMPHEMGREDIDRDFALGLHVPGTFYKVLDTRCCLLQPAAGDAIVEDVRRFVRQSPQPVYGLRSHRGFWRFLTLRHSVARDQWMVNIVTAHEDRGAIQPLADLLMGKHAGVVGVVNNITARKAGVALGEYEIPLAGQRRLVEHIGPLSFEVSANSFFQTNTRAAERLYTEVARFADLNGDETVFDLYCGTGGIALYLARFAREVIGFEIVEDAVRDAARNGARNGVANCRFVAGDVRDRLAAIDIRPDVMIIDPPRAGMHKSVVSQVLRQRPPKIVYVSCNPATLARDLAMLRDTYGLVEVRPFDMFPQTYHVEALARLEAV